jgi:hypothetical protein
MIQSHFVDADIPLLFASPASTLAPLTPSQEELSRVMQALWDADINRLPHDAFRVDLQSRVSQHVFEDLAPLRLVDAFLSIFFLH